MSVCVSVSGCVRDCGLRVGLLVWLCLCVCVWLCLCVVAKCLFAIVCEFATVL